MKKYDVTGMSCAACQARVEKAVSSVPGVESCAVSLLTNSMGVEGTADPAEVIRAVENAGYGAVLRENRISQGSNGQSGKIGNGGNIGTGGSDNLESLKDTETPKLIKRLIASLVLLVPLMYVSMGHMMWDWPLPPFMAGNHIAMGIYELLLTGLIMVINQRFFISGFKGLIHRAPNMDTLVALGSMASFAYSVYALFAMSIAVNNGETELAAGYMDEFYFESAAMILTLITVGKMLEARSKGKTTDALKALMKLSPKTAVLLQDGQEVTVPVEAVQVGDIFIVKPGAQIPVDGVVTDGFSAVDESAFTGECIPVEKKTDDTVSAGTINTNGFMTCRATGIGEDTALSKVIQMVSDAAATKAPIAKIADKVSGVFVPVVIGIAVVTFVVWILISKDFGYSLARAISVLVISCPCALGLATPVAIMVGSGVGARNGILFKTAATLEQVGSVKTVALDKTGTITTGHMQVTDVIAADGVQEQDLIRVAVALEKKSEHPISKAIMECKAAQSIDVIHEVTDFVVTAGNGLSGVLDNVKVSGGNAEFIGAQCKLTEFEKNAQALSESGKTPVYFASEGKLLGLIAVADTVKADSAGAIEKLKKMGLRVVMITGDNERTAQAIARGVGIDEVVASVKPDEKASVVDKLKSQGRVAMVGDGINDAPALTTADVGIAIGSGTDIAMDAADIVLTKNTLTDVVAAVRISRATIRNIYENLFWAFIYNMIGIPLAAGCFVALFGWSLNPMFGAAAMSLSSFCVVTNALRLNFVRLTDKQDRKENIEKTENIAKTENIEITENIETTEKENNTMKIKVNGMMCHHCEAHVKAALEKLDGVIEAVANHEENLVTITTSKEISEDAVKAAVTEAGYEYAGIA